MRAGRAHVIARRLERDAGDRSPGRGEALYAESLAFCILIAVRPCGIGARHRFFQRATERVAPFTSRFFKRLREGACSRIVD